MRTVTAFYALAGLFLLLVGACTARAPRPETGGLPDVWKPTIGPGPARSARVEISRVAPRPTIGSGTVISWYKFNARRIGRNRRGRDMAYFRIYLGESDRLPRIGEVCDIVYRFDRINGFGVGGSGLIRGGRVVTELDCAAPA